MAISTEITRLQTAKSNIKNAIENKGVSVPSTTKLDGYASLISQISGGGGDSKEDEIIDRTIGGTYINNTASSIGSYAFYSCTKLTNVSFPQCKSIGESAFFNCLSLANISFPQCTSIGSYAFNNCSNLTTALFPQCRSIRGSAFNGCNSLATASFPQCTSIGSYAFLYCYYLLSLYLLGSSIPTLPNANAFSSTPISNNTTHTGGVYGSIIVQPSMIDAFKTARNWSAYASRFSAWNGTD